MKHDTFIFESYKFDANLGYASFYYSFDGERQFVETVQFGPVGDYDEAVLDKALRLAHLIAGVSYYKCFPTRRVSVRNGVFTKHEAELLSEMYIQGLSQFMFENHLARNDMLQIDLNAFNDTVHSTPYDDRGVLALQSGGKDSLLLSELLKAKNISFSALYIASRNSHPLILDETSPKPLRTIIRTIDREALRSAKEDGGLDGHVPITFITLSYGLIDAILHKENVVLAAIGQEGNEAHEWIDDIPVNHQWSKTWQAEQLFTGFVRRVISPDLFVGSPLRKFTELKIAKLFVEQAWDKYGKRFSSCNVANYRQGERNDELRWCGECPKCANSFLLFMPFVEPETLSGLFGGNLLDKELLRDTFKGLLGIDGVMKPFECVGEVDELRLAYHMARNHFSVETYALPFEVPESHFDYEAFGESQSWCEQYVS